MASRINLYSFNDLAGDELKQTDEQDRLPGADGFAAAEVAGAAVQSWLRCFGEPHRKHFPFAGEDDLLSDCSKR